MFDEPDSDDDSVPAMTIQSLRDKAIELFDMFIAQTSGLPLSRADVASPEEKEEFLSLKETENIIREYAEVGPDVYAIGGDTPEEAHKKIRVLMAALVQRVLSNVLRVGADAGLIEVAFDSDANDFKFGVTEKGNKVYDRIQSQIKNGEEIDYNFDADDED